MCHFVDYIYKLHKNIKKIVTYEEKKGKYKITFLSDKDI